MTAVDQVDPTAAYMALQASSAARLIDVRTHAEWVFTGMPDLSATNEPVWPIEWRQYPHMAVDDQFIERLEARLEGEKVEHLLFICRSGQRSLEAAHAAAGSPRCAGVRLSNVDEGFEGVHDADGRRGGVNGWKARGLPWRQP